MNPSPSQTYNVGAVRISGPLSPAEPAAPPVGIAKHVEDMHRTAESLASGIDRLAKRLEPLCVPPPPGGAKAVGANASRSPLGAMLFEHVLRLECLSERLADLYERLEV